MLQSTFVNLGGMNNNQTFFFMAVIGYVKFSKNSYKKSNEKQRLFLTTIVIGGMHFKVSSSAKKGDINGSFASLNALLSQIGN